MKLELVVKKFYEGLEEGVIYARRCKECGAIEFPPHYACNTCGYHETEWTTLSGNGALKTVILPATTTADNTLAAIGPYGFGEVELDEGCTINAVIFGLTTKNRDELRKRIAAGERIGVHPHFTQMDGYKALHFELD